MHTFYASGTESQTSVPAAQGGDAPNVAALQKLWDAMSSLIQGMYLLSIAPPTIHLRLLSPDPTAATASVSATSTSAAPAPAITVATATAAAPISSPAAPPAAAPAAPTTAFLMQGPWVVGGLYKVVPAGPLTAIPEDTAEDSNWYSIVRGRYVGVTLSNALASAAVNGVSNQSMKGYKSQALAMAAFNEMLGYGLVSVLT